MIMDPIRQTRLTDRLPIAGAAVAGVAVAAVAALLPAALLERVVGLTGIDTLVPVAAPPLGTTARAILALGGGVVAAAVAWAILFLLFGPGGLFAPRAGAAPVMRRADAHPDAPPRRPVSAADLGPPPPPAGELVPPPPAEPTPSPPEKDLPRDLDQPLASFDASAIPDVPRAPSPALPSLAPPPALEAGERIETFDLSPRDPGSTAPSIAELLARLERSTARRTPD